MPGRFWVLALTFCIAFLATSCTKPTKTSKLTLSIPKTLTSKHSKAAKQNKAGALLYEDFTSPIKHVAINISAGGEFPALYQGWDSHRCGEDALVCSPPAEFSFPDVPNGEGRLVQVLIVTGEEDEGEVFWYGDKLTVVEGETPVAVTVEEFNGVTSPTEGNIMGRYYMTVIGVGGVPTVINPSGQILTKLIPPPAANGAIRPAMIVDQSEMIAGWFSVFGFAEIPFTYELVGRGKLTIGNVQDVQLDSLTMDANMGKVEIPETYQTWDGRKDQPRVVVYGKFGDTGALASGLASSLTTCYDPALSYGYTQKLLPTPALLDTSDLTFDYGSLASCTGADQFDDEIYFFPEAHDGNGSEVALGFRGPFKGKVVTGPDGNNFTTVDTSTTDSIKWEFLPDVNSVIAGVKVFARTEPEGNSGDNRDYEGENGGTQCSKLVSDYNFNLLATVPWSAGVNVHSAAGLFASLGNSTVILCPVRMDGSLSSEAAETHMGMGGGGGGGGMGGSEPDAVRISNAPPAGVAEKIGSDLSVMAPCVPYHAVPMNSGYPVSFNSYNSMTITSTNANVTVHSGPSCTGNISGSPQTLTGSNNYFQFYLQSHILNGASASINISMTDGTDTRTTSMLLTSIPVPAGFPGTLNKGVRFIVPTTTIRAFECYKAEAQQIHYNASAPGNSFITNYTISDFNLEVPVGFDFYDGSTGGPCEGTAMASGTNLTFTGGIPRRPLYFRYKGAAKNPLLTLDRTGANPSSVTVKTVTLTVTQPGPARSARLEMQMGATVGECSMVAIRIQDRNGNPAGAFDPMNFALDDLNSLGTFFVAGDTTCTGGGTSSISFDEGDAVQYFHYKPTADGPTVITAFSDSTPLMLAGVSSIDVEPPSAQSFWIEGNADTHNSGSSPPIAGGANSETASASFTITVHAVMADNTDDPNFDGPPIPTLNSGNFTFNNPNLSFISATPWSNGMCTVTLMAGGSGTSSQIDDIVLDVGGGNPPLHLDGGQAPWSVTFP